MSVTVKWVYDFFNLVSAQHMTYIYNFLLILLLVISRSFLLWGYFHIWRVPPIHLLIPLLPLFFSTV